MDQLIIILYICILVPTSLGLIFMRDHTRTTVIFLGLGLTSCLFAAYINGYIRNISGMSEFDMTYLVTPLVEELLKMIPIVQYVFLFRPKKRDIVSSSIMVGIGFAILENSYILASDIGAATIGWAFIRGLGAGMMHGICTLMVGFGLTLFYIRRKFSVVGTYALLIFAVVYHACYNLLIQSAYRFGGIILPLFTVAVMLSVHLLNKKIVKSEKTDHERS